MVATATGTPTTILRTITVRFVYFLTLHRQLDTRVGGLQLRPASCSWTWLDRIFTIGSGMSKSCRSEHHTAVICYLKKMKRERKSRASQKTPGTRSPRQRARKDSIEYQWHISLDKKRAFCCLSLLPC